MWENTSLLFKPLSLWRFATAALENEYNRLRSLRVGYLLKLFGIILHGVLFLLPHLVIYSIFFYISMDSWAHGYFFYALDRNLMMSLTLLFKFFQLWPLWALSAWLLHTWDLSSSFWFLSVSSVSGTTSCSRLIWPIPCPIPRNSHFSKEPWSPLLENGTETKIWVLLCSWLLRYHYFQAPWRQDFCPSWWIPSTTVPVT